MNLSPQQIQILTVEMQRDRTSGACSVCKTRLGIEMHHVKPVELGGLESGLTVPLCGTDHTTVHRAGEWWVDNSGDNPYIQQYTDPMQAARATLLAQQITRARDEFNQSSEVISATARNAITTHFSPDELSAAHDLKRQLGFRSLERLIKYLILTEWRNRRASTSSSH